MAADEDDTPAGWFVTVPGAAPGQRKRVACPLWRPELHGAGVDGGQTNECLHCRRTIIRWLRPRRSDQHRAWRHDGSGTEYCYGGLYEDVVPDTVTGTQ